MKNLLMFALGLLFFVGQTQAQVNYEVRKKNGVTTYRAETVAGSSVFDGPILSTLPQGAATARIASAVKKPWKPEPPKKTIDWAQFGTGGTKSVFKLSSDFRPDQYSHDQWRQLGFNLISRWSSDKRDGTDKWSDVPNNQKLEYEVEGSLYTNTSGGPRWAGHYFYTASLAQMESVFMASIPGYGQGAQWTANIEESNYWSRDYYPGVNYPNWDAVKGMNIQLESEPGNMTLEQLVNSGKAPFEMRVRRSNRNGLMLLVAKRNGAMAAFGSSMWQGEPRTDCLQTSNRFLDEADMNVSNIGGSNGTITLNGHTYTGMTGSFYKHEDYHLDYHYYFDFDYTGSNYEAEPDYPSLWPKVYVMHPIAREIGHWMANRKRMIDVHGKQIPAIRMHELFFEGNARVPGAFGLNGTNEDGAGPKPWVPPYIIRLQYMLQHILEGETFGSGYHIFHAAGSPNQGIEYDFASKPKYNHHMHTATSLIAARRDMEGILDKIAGSTLYTDLQIKIGNQGSFQTVNGVSAYNFQPDGKRGDRTPCFVMRTKQTDAGLYVLIAGGHDQGWDDTRTDAIQIPGSTNEIQVTYKGRDLAVFETLIPTGTIGQTFIAKSIVSDWEKKGYGGRIITNGGDLLLISLALGTALRRSRKLGIRQRKPSKTSTPKIRI